MSKVFLDDERIPPSGWTLVKTPKEAIDLLKTGKVTELSLDHDLGDDKNIGTGYDVLLWLEEQVYLHGFKPPEIIKVHSANLSARQKMELAIKSIEKKSNVGEVKMKQSDLIKMVKEEITSVLSEDGDGIEFQDSTVQIGGSQHPAYLFTVPNNPDGIDRIKRAKDALKDIYTFKLRGRHHDRKELLGAKYIPGRNNEVPLKQAEFIAVYAYPKK